MTDLEKLSIRRIQTILKTNPQVMLNVRLMDHKSPIKYQEFSQYCKDELNNLSGALHEIGQLADALLKDK